MPAYVIAGVRITGDPDNMRIYRERIDATHVPYGGRFLARTSDIDVLEGEWPADSLVVVEFPTLELAKAWNASAEYRPLARLREASAESIRIVVDGC